MKKKWLKSIFVLLILYISLCLCTPHIDFLRQRSIENQINHISYAIENGGDAEMQQLYPEGAFFTIAIFALSLIEWEASKKVVNTERIKLIDSMVLRLLSPSIKQNFHQNIDPSHGAFYIGWSNFVLSRYIHSKIFKRSLQQNVFLLENYKFTKTIINSFHAKNNIESYQNAAWPPDNLACLASIRDSVTHQKWLSFIKQYSKKHGDGGIPHAFNYKPTVRGCSLTLMIYFLSYIDLNYAREQNEFLSKKFVDNFVGHCIVKESIGETVEDVDSGVVIFGYGSVATINNIKAMQALKQPQAKSTWALLNLAGAPINLLGKKIYLFNHMLIFDIFMLWTSVDLE